MSNVVPFTKNHEDLLYSCSERIDRNSSQILENSKKIDENSRKIEENGRKIELNREGIELNREGILRNGILLEDLGSKLETVLEVVTHMDSRLEKQEVLKSRLQNHEYRISAIEMKVKASDR